MNKFPKTDAATYLDQYIQGMEEDLDELDRDLEINQGVTVKLSEKFTIQRNNGDFKRDKLLPLKLGIDDDFENEKITVLAHFQAQVIYARNTGSKYQYIDILQQRGDPIIYNYAKQFDVNAVTNAFTPTNNKQAELFLETDMDILYNMAMLPIRNLDRYFNFYLAGSIAEEWDNALINTVNGKKANEKASAFLLIIFDLQDYVNDNYDDWVRSTDRSTLVDVWRTKRGLKEKVPQSVAKQPEPVITIPSSTTTTTPTTKSTTTSVTTTANTNTTSTTTTTNTTTSTIPKPRYTFPPTGNNTSTTTPSTTTNKDPNAAEVDRLRTNLVNLEDDFRILQEERDKLFVKNKEFDEIFKKISQSDGSEKTLAASELRATEAELRAKTLEVNLEALKKRNDALKRYEEYWIKRRILHEDGKLTEPSNKTDRDFTLISGHGLKQARDILEKAHYTFVTSDKNGKRLELKKLPIKNVTELYFIQNQDLLDTIKDYILNKKSTVGGAKSVLSLQKKISLENYHNLFPLSNQGTARIRLDFMDPDTDKVFNSTEAFNIATQNDGNDPTYLIPLSNTNSYDRIYHKQLEFGADVVLSEFKLMATLFSSDGKIESSEYNVNLTPDDGVRSGESYITKTSDGIRLATVGMNKSHQQLDFIVIPKEIFSSGSGGSSSTTNPTKVDVNDHNGKNIVSNVFSSLSEIIPEPEIPIVEDDSVYVINTEVYENSVLDAKDIIGVGSDEEDWPTHS